MSTTVRLRRWQRRALERLEAHPGADFLTVATPGAGKTTFALVAVRRRMAGRPHDRIVIVVPTAHLKTQWTAAAARFGLVLDDAWHPGTGSLPGDVHGVVTTYQQVATSAARLGALTRGGMVILDEVHHAGDERAWGAGVRTAFGDASWRLALSGTPFRSDSHAIPFVRYALDEALPDFEYGYGDALAEGRVIRQIEFPVLDGEMEWIDSQGTVRSATFDETLSGTLASQRLRTALSVEGEWLPAVLGAANDRLVEMRRRQSDAAGLVIATDQAHAHAIADLLRRRHRIRAVVATSDDAGASETIARFAVSNDPWLVAVRMVSEGVDIPRLAVGVYATTTTTELFFRQAVGRFVRHRPGEDDVVATLFLPADRRLRMHARELTNIRRHHLVTTSRRTVEEPVADRDTPEEQMSLFAPVSATPSGTVRGAQPAGFVTAPSDPTPVGDDLVVLELPPLPGRTGRADESSPPHPTRRRRHLRDLNAARAAELVRHANMSHASVNAELNRLAGIRRITEATETQLERRLAAAERWLRS